MLFIKFCHPKNMKKSMTSRVIHEFVDRQFVETVTLSKPILFFRLKQYHCFNPLGFTKYDDLHATPLFFWNVGSVRQL